VASFELYPTLFFSDRKVKLDFLFIHLYVYVIYQALVKT